MNVTRSTLNIIFLGTAGCGKTTLVNEFGRWLKKSCHYDVRYVNLDPACLETPFSPDFDVRSLFTTKEIMERERLGPNAAIIRCSDLMSESANKIAGSIESLEGDVRLIDTPGQMEVFVFRESGPRIAEALTRTGYTVTVMLFDKTLTSTPIDVATAQLMTLVVRLRIGVPMITAISKTDLLPDSDIEELLSDQSSLIKAIERESKQEGVYRDLALELSSIIRDFKSPIRLVRTSATTRTGFSELLDIINETSCACGDLT